MVTGRVEKIAVIPHEKRCGMLRNGNPSGDFSKAARCGGRIAAAHRGAHDWLLEATARGRPGPGPKQKVSSDGQRWQTLSGTEYRPGTRKDARREIRSLVNMLRVTRRGSPVRHVQETCGPFFQGKGVPVPHSVLLCFWL